MRYIFLALLLSSPLAINAVAAVMGNPKGYGGVASNLVKQSPDGTFYELTVANGGTSVWVQIDNPES